MAVQREQETIGSENGLRPDSRIATTERTNKEKREEVLVAFNRQFEEFRDAPETDLEDWEAAERGEMAEILDTGKVDFAKGVDSFRENGHIRRLPIQAFMNFVAVKADEDEQVESDRRILEKYSRSPISTIRRDGQISRQTHRQLADEAAQATQDRRSAVRRAQTGVRWFYPPKNADINNTTPETSHPQDLSGAMQVFEEALRRYRHANSPIDKKAAKRELDLITRQMGDLTGDPAAVREFLETRREEARKSGKADRGTATKIEIRTSKLRIEQAAEKLYELEDLRNNEPIILGNSLSSGTSDHGSDLPSDSAEEIIKTSPWLTSMIEGAERDNPPLRQDEAPWGKPDIDPKVQVITSSGEFLTKWEKPKENSIKKTQEDLHIAYLEAWKDAEKRRIRRDEENPTPRYFIPEIKVTSTKPQSKSIASIESVPDGESLSRGVPQNDQPQSPTTLEAIERMATTDEWMDSPLPEINQLNTSRNVNEPSKDDLNSIDQKIDREEHPIPSRRPTLTPPLPDPVHATPSPMAPIFSYGSITRMDAAPITFSFASSDPIWEREARKNALRQIEEDLAPGKNWKEKLRRAPRVAWARLNEEGRVRDYAKEAEVALRSLGNPFAEIDVKNKQVINGDAHREDYTYELSATGIGLEVNPHAFASHIERATGLFGARLNDKILALATSSISESEARESFMEFVKENRYDFNRLFGRSSNQESFGDFATNISDRIGILKQQLSAGVVTKDQAARNINIIFADARWGVETKPTRSRKDKFVDWSQSGRLRRVKGVIANPASIGIATSAGTAVALSASAARAALAPISATVPVVPIAVGSFFGGTYGAIRRHADIGKDRTTFEIDDASGEKIQSDSRQRESLAKFSRDRISAEQLATEVDVAIGLDLSTELGKQVLMAKLGEIAARQKLSVTTGADYIRYSSPYQIQREKLALQEAFQRGELALRSSGISYDDFDSSLRSHIADRIAELSDATKKQDREFKKHRRKESGKAFIEGAGKGAAAAVGFGVVKATIGAAGEVLGIDLGTEARQAVDTVHDIFVPSAKAATPDLGAQVNFYDTKLNGKLISIPDTTRLVPDRVSGGYDLVSSQDGKTVLLNDVRWEDGKLVADPKSPWADQISSQTTTSPDTRTVLGKNGVWKEMSADIKTVDWDSNGTPGEYDRDELRIFNRRDGNGVVFNIPKSSNGIFLNINGKRVWLPETKNGIVRLDPDSTKLIPGRHDSLTYGDVARIAIDQDELKKYHGSLQTEVHTQRREIFRVDTIEAGTLKGGKATIHATIQGCGETPREIKMGDITTSVTKILPGEIPAITPEPTPTPTPTPVPTPEPTPTPTPSPEPTPSPSPSPEPTPSPTPSPNPEPSPNPSPEPPVIPPPIGAGRTFPNFDFAPLIAVPFVARKPLEVTIVPTAPHTIYSGPSVPPSPTPYTYRASQPTSGWGSPDSLTGSITPEREDKIVRLLSTHLDPSTVALWASVSEEAVLEIKNRYGI